MITKTNKNNILIRDIRENLDLSKSRRDNEIVKRIHDLVVYGDYGIDDAAAIIDKYRRGRLTGRIIA